MYNRKKQQLLLSETAISDQAIVIVHGIWVNSWVMRKLARRLSNQGYVTYLFDYQSVKKSPEQNARLLSEFVKTIDQPVVHFVAHSLGGLVLLHYLNLSSQQDQDRTGRVVMLGSPLNGSSRAPRILRIPFGRHLLGHSVQKGLLGHDLQLPAELDAGMICGTFRLGIGMIVGSFGEPHDGTVAVKETQFKGLTDSINIRISHTGMLLSAKIAQQVVDFLQNGLFSHS